RARADGDRFPERVVAPLLEDRLLVLAAPGLPRVERDLHVDLPVVELVADHLVELVVVVAEHVEDDRALRTLEERDEHPVDVVARRPEGAEVVRVVIEEALVGFVPGELSPLERRRGLQYLLACAPLPRGPATDNRPASGR